MKHLLPTLIPTLPILVSVCALGLPTQLFSASIGLDFGDENATTALASTESAGIVPQLNWNSIVAVSGIVNRTTPLSLVNQAGITSGATATWSGATDDWSLPISTTGGNNHMMRGYLENINNGTITISILNIPYPFYDVYIYADAEGTSSRQGTYSYSTSSGLLGFQLWNDPNVTEFSGTFIENQNYVKFSSLSGANLDLSATVITLRAPINAVQIVSTVPEPSSIVLLVLGASFLCARPTKRTQNRAEQ